MVQKCGDVTALLVHYFIQSCNWLSVPRYGPAAGGIVCRSLLIALTIHWSQLQCLAGSRAKKTIKCTFLMNVGALIIFAKGGLCQKVEGIQNFRTKGEWNLPTETPVPGTIIPVPHFGRSPLTSCCISGTGSEGQFPQRYKNSKK